MIRTSGDAPLPLSAIRWWTPNRCCSSMTASERSANATPSCTRACVPTTRSTSPAAIPSRILARSLPVTAAVSNAYVARGGTSSSGSGSNNEAWAPSAFAGDASSKNGTAPQPPRSASTCRKCCPASTSVGAMIAAWWPDPIATRAACTATSVLPEPTSPWSRTFIGRGRAIAASISSVDRRDPPRMHQVLIVALEQLDLLVRELEPPSVQLRDARDRDLVPLLVHRSRPGLVEERQVEVPRAVVQRDRDHRLPAPGLP